MADSAFPPHRQSAPSVLEGVHVALPVTVTVTVQGQRHSVGCSDSDTLDTLFARTATLVSNGQPGRLRLFHGGLELIPSPIPLKDCDLRHGGVVHGVWRPGPEPAVVYQVSPASCMETGGAKIHVYGRGYLDSRAVCCKFGSTIVPATFHSSSLVTCIAPPHAPGIVSVEVSSDGHHFTASNQLFTYYGNVHCPGMVGVAVGARNCTAINVEREMERAAWHLRRDSC